MYEVYMVKMGDSMESIATSHDISVDELKKINGLFSPNEVVVGSLLVVPVMGKRNYQYYTVKKGDSIYEIAKKYGIDYNLLLQLNGLDKDDYIYPNQSLMLPAEGIEFYLVKENETLQDILRKKKVSADDLMKNNDKIYLREGQLLQFQKN